MENMEEKNKYYEQQIGNIYLFYERLTINWQTIRIRQIHLITKIRI